MWNITGTFLVNWRFTTPMSRASKFFSYVTMISYFFIVIMNEFFTNLAKGTWLKLFFFFFTHDQIFVKAFFHYFFTVFILFKNRVNKFISSIFTYKKTISLVNLSSTQTTQKLVFISYKQQQVRRVFKFLIWNINWKSQFVFITIYINANNVLFFSLAKIFFSYRETNPIIIKIISQLFIILCNSLWMYIYRIDMPNMTP